MANGKNPHFDDYWAGIPDDEMTRVAIATKHSFVYLSRILESAPCEKHNARISRIEKLVWVLTGIGLFATAVIIPFVVNNWDKIFRG